MVSYAHKCLVPFDRSQLGSLFSSAGNPVDLYEQGCREIHVLVKYLGEENIQIGDTLDGGKWKGIIKDASKVSGLYI